MASDLREKGHGEATRAGLGWCLSPTEQKSFGIHSWSGVWSTLLRVGDSRGLAAPGAPLQCHHESPWGHSQRIPAVLQHPFPDNARGWGTGWERGRAAALPKWLQERDLSVPTITQPRGSTKSRPRRGQSSWGGEKQHLPSLLQHCCNTWSCSNSAGKQQGDKVTPQPHCPAWLCPLTPHSEALRGAKPAPKLPSDTKVGRSRLHGKKGKTTTKK